MPEVYEFLEAEQVNYAIPLPANQILQDRIGYLLKRPVGRPSVHANFTYQQMPRFVDEEEVAGGVKIPPHATPKWVYFV